MEGQAGAEVVWWWWWWWGDKQGCEQPVEKDADVKAMNLGRPPPSPRLPQSLFHPVPSPPSLFSSGLLTQTLLFFCSPPVSLASVIRIQ